MKFTILKDNLTKGLNLVERITGRNLILPILNNVLLSTEKNILKLVTTDLEVAIIYRCLAKIEKEGEITVPVKVLSNFTSLIDDQRITFELKRNIFHLSGENYKTQIKGLDPKDFPIIPKIEESESIEMDPIPFCEGINQVIDFCSITQTRPELSGVYFSFNKNQLKLVATDSFRLAEKTLNFEKEGLSAEKSFILPRNAARELVNLFSETKGMIRIYFSANQVMFESKFPETDNPQSQIVSRLIEGEFPNYEEIIPKGSKTKIEVEQIKLQNGIKSASLFSGKGNELTIKVEPKKNQIEIMAQDTEVGETDVVIPAKITGEKVDICFNYKFLLEGVSKIKGKEVIIELNGEGGPGMIKSGKNQNLIHILMPIKPT